MKLFRILTWLTGFLYLVLIANHFLNPHFHMGMNSIFAISFVMFTLAGIQEHREGRKKIAAFYIFTGAVSFIGLTSAFIR